jgi:hypothetical protein
MITIFLFLHVLKYTLFKLRTHHNDKLLKIYLNLFLLIMFLLILNVQPCLND